MVRIIGDIAGIPLRLARRVQESIPNRWLPPAFVGRVLNLIGCGGAAPEKVGGEAQQTGGGRLRNGSGGKIVTGKNRAGGTGYSLGKSAASNLSHR